MKKTKVICVGEALIDRIKNKSNQESNDFLGGAPANVACALKKLRIDSIFIGRLGNDEFGKKIIDKFIDLGVNIDFLQEDKKHPTRVVKVSRDPSGDRYFSGFDASQKTIFADEALDRISIERDLNRLEKLLKETKYFVAGTILLSSQASSESIYYLLNLVKKFDVKIIVDLNWRKVFWDHSTYSSTKSQQERIDLIRKFVNQAHILKLAREEAILFFDNENPLKISEKVSTRPDVIITDGPNPISWLINNVEGNTKIPISSEIVDTTGAGDAFLAGLIQQLISVGLPSNESEIQNIVKFASVCGLLTCTCEGAIEHQPSYEKVSEFLGFQI